MLNGDYVGSVLHLDDTYGLIFFLWNTVAWESQLMETTALENQVLFQPCVPINWIHLGDNLGWPKQDLFPDLTSRFMCEK